MDVPDSGEHGCKAMRQATPAHESHRRPASGDYNAFRNTQSLVFFNRDSGFRKHWSGLVRHCSDCPDKPTVICASTSGRFHKDLFFYYRLAAHRIEGADLMDVLPGEINATDSLPARFLDENLHAIEKGSDLLNLFLIIHSRSALPRQVVDTLFSVGIPHCLYLGADNKDSFRTQSSYGARRYDI